MDRTILYSAFKPEGHSSSIHSHRVEEHNKVARTMASDRVELQLV